MKLIGSLLLVSGWLIVLAALLMLPGAGQRMAFITSGLCLELLGLALLTRSYTADQREAK